MSTKNSLDVQGIISRAKECLHLETDTQLANLMGIKPNTISAWKKRGNPDLIALITLCDNVNMNWLLFGRGDKGVKEGDVVNKIVALVQDMEEEEQREILKHIQKEELLSALLKKQAGGAR